jgi:hypothetical protein
MQRTFDVTAVREQFPTLEREHNGRRVAYLDGPGGSQAASSAIDAVTRYMSRGSAPTCTAPSRRASRPRRSCTKPAGSASPRTTPGKRSKVSSDRWSS